MRLFQGKSVEQKHSVSEEEAYGTGRLLWEMVKIGALAFIIIVPVRVFLFQPFFVQGSSMEPNFHNGEYLIVGEFGYKETNLGIGGFDFVHVTPFRELHRGDSVVFRPPGVVGQYFIKRVIGLPGETVSIRDTHVFIKSALVPAGFLLDESSYLTSSVHTFGDRDVTLGNNEYYLLGDNREASRDSRSFGPVPKNRITGKVLIRAWPLDRAGIL